MKEVFKRKSVSNKKIALIVISLLVVGMVIKILVFSGDGNGGFRVGEVTRQDLLQKVTVTGMVTAIRSTIIMAPYDGYIKKLYVKLGDRVPVGNPLVSVAQTLQGIEPVYPIRSPFSGTVVHLLKSEGQYVRKDDAREYIMRVDDLTQLFVDVDAPEIDMAKISKGQLADIRATAILGKIFKGVVQDIFSASNQKDNSWQRSQVDFRIRVKILEETPDLRPGMSALVDIVTQKKEKVLTLAHEFIHEQGDEHFVIRSDGTRQKIKVGLQNETVSEVVEGLREKEKIRQVDFLKIPEKKY